MSTVDLCAESALRLGADKLSQFLEAEHHHPGKGLADDAQEKDAPLLVTIAHVTLVLIKSDDSSITQVVEGEDPCNR